MMKHLRFIITANDSRKRLDHFLASQLGSLSRIRIANLLAAGACRVNSEVQRAGYHLATGDAVEITIDETSAPSAMTPENIPLDIVYEDDEIIVVNKPSAMLVHPTRNTKTGTLVNALAYHLNQVPINGTSSPSTIIRPGLIHRLDRATSGLMIVAKTQRALSILSVHFHKKRVLKRYLALVHGQIANDEGVIIAPIGEDKGRKPPQPPRWVMPEGKYAETRFRVLEQLPEATLVELEPVTGRTNQLRIHLAYIGHPIFGDEIYGDARRQTPDSIRLCLHAARLEFHHPTGGKWMQFQAPCPEEINNLLNLLREAQEA